MTGVLHIAVILISPHLFSKTSILLSRGLDVFPMLNNAVSQLSHNIRLVVGYCQD
jgi:hypothetical protein